jgi:hypothetical protein
MFWGEDGSVDNEKVSKDGKHNKRHRNKIDTNESWLFCAQDYDRIET